MSAAPDGLVWGIKESFLKYVTHSGDATFVFEGGVEATDEGAFFFPYAGRDSGGALCFSGAVRISAHGGLMELRIAAPSVDWSGDAGVLRIAAVGDAAADGGELRIATLQRRAPERDGGSEVWRGIPADLHEDALALFNRVYGPGEALSPVSMRVPA